MSNQLKAFVAALFDRSLMPTALKVSIVVGSLLFAINHGTALVQGKMTRSRWASGVLTYLVPYAVNIHGQATARSRSAPQQTRSRTSSQKPIH